MRPGLTWYFYHQTLTVVTLTRETILNPLLAGRFLSKEIFQKPLEISGRIIRSSLDKRIQKFCVTNLEDILTEETGLIF